VSQIPVSLTIPAQTTVTAFCLDKAQPIEAQTFPNPPRLGSRQPPTTLPNVQHVLNTYGVTVQYDVISKRLVFKIPGLSIPAENAENTALTEIISLTQLNGFLMGPIKDYIAGIGDRNHVNPVADWIGSKPWDGTDRLQPLLATIKVQEGYPEVLRNVLVYRWLLSAVAAALNPLGFKSRGVLTLQGGQGIGKTSWLIALVPEHLRASFIKVDHHLDASDKDSILGAVSHWIVEIGELDSSFKKDIARLKGFLTATHDKVRRPYAKDESNYPRRTVFAATVNENNFLVDLTGNTRWWTVEVSALDFNHDIDTQQLFAQLALDVQRGEQWWLTQEEELQLDEQNKAYLTVSVVRDRLDEYLSRCSEDSKPPACMHMTATEILECIGLKQPGNALAREAAPILRERFGPRKKKRGKEGWSFPGDVNLLSVEMGR